MDGTPGFAPRQTESKSVMLLLHHVPIMDAGARFELARLARQIMSLLGYHFPHPAISLFTI
jgi:hypothetical protein